MDLNWLENHLLPCPFKAVTGMDCPGCGLQRSFLALLQGNLHESFHLYPALLPVIFTFIFLFLHLKFRFVNGAKLLMVFYIFTASTIVVSYIFKEVVVHLHG